MPNNKEYLMELIFKKLKNNTSRKIYLEKKEFTEFIDSLINNNLSWKITNNPFKNVKIKQIQ